MITRDQSIELVVKGLQEELPGYWTVTFERPPRFVFEAGDWMDIRFGAEELAGGKTYSFSSSPTEPDVAITFKHGASQLKRALQTVRVGDRVYMTQYGNGYDFQLNSHRSSMLIAGGVGIAPFRGMLKQMVDTGDHNEVKLVYMNRTEPFLFGAELNEWREILPALSIEYITTEGMNRKKREKLLRAMMGNTNQSFYIAGPPSMVEATEHLLIDAGIPVKNIRIDSFGGY